MQNKLHPYIKSLTQYLENQGLKLKPYPKLIFKNDENEANDILGKTGYYDPNSNSITIYCKNRHPKDQLRTLSHEYIHVNQNNEGRLNNITTDNINEDDYLKQLEEEAYLKGNILFRGWENNIKEYLK